MRPIAEIVLHCSATRPEWMAGKAIHAPIEEIRRWHMDGNGWRYIGYHFIIDRRGNVGMGRPVTQDGAHTLGRNAGTIGICLLGGHGSSAHDRFANNFTPEQDAALRALIKRLRKDHPTITLISGHNQYAAKACPGFQVQTWLHSQSAASDATWIGPGGIDGKIPDSAFTAADGPVPWGKFLDVIKGFFTAIFGRSKK